MSFEFLLGPFLTINYNLFHNLGNSFSNLVRFKDLDEIFQGKFKILRLLGTVL